MVEDALTIATAAGDLREAVERMPGWSGGGPDIVIRYTHELTGKGQEKIGILQRDRPDGWTKIRAAVNAISEVLTDLNQMMLSSAAKTYLIIDEIPKLAKRLGPEAHALSSQPHHRYPSPARPARGAGHTCLIAVRPLRRVLVRRIRVGAPPVPLPGVLG